MNVTKAFTYYGMGGVPQTGAELILKDLDGVEADVVMTEIGNGVYKAVVPLGTIWKVYDNATPPGVDTTFMIEAGYGRSREPAIPAGTDTYVWTGAKAWTMLTKGMVVGLNESLTAIEDEAAQVASAEATERARVDTILSETISSLSTAVQKLNEETILKIGANSYSNSPISIRSTAFPWSLGVAFSLSFGTGVVFSNDGVVAYSTEFATIAQVPVGAFPAQENFGAPEDSAPLPFLCVSRKGAVREFGVDFCMSEYPTNATGGMDLPNWAHCDFQLSLLHIKADGSNGAQSAFVAPVQHVVSQAMNGKGFAQFWVKLPAPLEIIDPGGYFVIVAKAKANGMISGDIDLGTCHHANACINLYPKVA